MSDYDTYLARCVEDYYNPRVSELTIRGTSLFDVIACKKESSVQEIFTNVPMDYWKNIDVSDGDSPMPRWDDVCDKIEDDYFHLEELECFEYLDAEEENETQLPENYEVVKILGFSKGHSFEEFEIEQ